jgi:diguanylate cyclase (GGDEF)-like protein/PAS domain S-box-containing protein
MNSSAVVEDAMSERVIATALDAVDEGIIICDSEDRLVSWNSAMLKLFPTLEALYKPGTTFEHLLRAAAEHEYEAGLITDVESWVAGRMEIHGSSGRTFEQRQTDDRWLRITDQPTDDGGRIVLYRDVSDERQHAANAFRYTELLRLTLENISQGLCAYDSDFRLITWNARFFELLDLRHTHAQAGTPLRDICLYLARRGEFGEGDPAELADKVVTMFSQTTGVTYERSTVDGRFLEIRASPVASGGVVVTYTDITDRMKSEQRLRESEERYALAAAGSNDGLWDWDLANSRLFLSDRFKEMLGHQPDELGDGPEEWLSRIHPEDMQRFTAQLDAHLNGITGNFEIEHRVLHSNDTWRWMLAKGQAVRKNRGTPPIDEAMDNATIEQPHRMAGSLTDVTDRRRAEEQSIHDALHDSLTGLANRTLFLERVMQALARRRRKASAKFAVIYLDLDRFKVVNESLGHVHGDDLIIAAARRLEQSLKFGDTVARLGGDEFAILLEDVEEKNEALAISEMLQKTLSSPFNLGGREIFSSASMGIAHSEDDYQRPEDILRDSEFAMYKAKEFGKARSVIFERDLRKANVTPLDVESDLRRALERGEMTLAYQPIIALDTGRIAGFEALIRWRHSKRGDVPPSEFIPLAEETGMIVELGQWVLRTACAQMVVWNDSYGKTKPLELSVNLSGRQFAQVDLVKMVTQSLSGTGLPPHCLKLEITESALMENATRSADMLRDLKRLDIQVCIDDFGTGYSSLSYLHTFPIDTLKIDKSFVHDMGRNRQNLEIVRTIALLAQNLRMDVIAEGVETPEQLAQLRAIGCGFAQGFLFSRPCSVDSIDALLTENQVW